MSSNIAKIAKVTRILVQLKTPVTSIAKIKNLTRIKTQKEKKPRIKGPEMSANMQKTRKSNKDFSCELKTPVTNIAKIVKITNVTKFLTQKAKKPRRGPR